MTFIYPYVLEQVPPRIWQVDGRPVELAAAWRLKRQSLGGSMLRVKLSTVYLGVTFQREYIEVKSTKFKNSPTYKLRATYCNLHRLTEEGKTDAIIARSFVKCTSADRYEAEEGRKKALTRALKQHALTRPERTQVWKAYHSRPRPVSKPKAKVQPVEEAMVNILDLTDEPQQQADGYLDLTAEPRETDPARQNLLALRADADYHETNKVFVGLDLNAGEGVH